MAGWKEGLADLHIEGLTTYVVVPKLLLAWSRLFYTESDIAQR